MSAAANEMRTSENANVAISSQVLMYVYWLCTSASCYYIVRELVIASERC